uniref:Predicted protein n=1 Tax=Hordeum vulgare subsp. vulgare TaxID=112509 RepID=F2DVX8_HORVV|nr:predicted protein [Hordeum vulgare subsp. vulgare]
MEERMIERTRWTDVGDRDNAPAGDLRRDEAWIAACSSVTRGRSPRQIASLEIVMITRANDAVAGTCTIVLREGQDGASWPSSWRDCSR